MENNQYLYSSKRKEIKWLPLNEHPHYRDIVMTFRCMKGLAPTYLCESLRRRKSIHHHNTRNRESLDFPPSKTKSGQRRFLHRAVNIWNNLDKDFKQLSLTSFKKNSKMHMLNNYFNLYFIILFIFYYNVLCCLVLKIPLGNTNKVCVYEGRNLHNTIVT